MVPSDFLLNYVAQYKITSGELEVLKLILAGKSIAEIALDLGIQANAVRKRLGEVYAKFAIAGKGPGKLVKLQQHLVSAYQAQTARKKILVVWSGEVGKLVAEGLRQTIFKHPQLEVLLCDRDLSASSWRSSVKPLTGNLDLCLCCLGNMTTAINFGLGWLLGRIERIRLLQFQEAIPEYWADLPLVKAHDPVAMQNLLESLIGNLEAKEWLDYQLLPWQNILRTTAVHSSADIDDRNWLPMTRRVEEAVKALTQNQYVTDNSCFQRVLLHSLAEINHQLETRSSHLILASLYPRYLASLQKRAPIAIKALTLVDRDEDFWQQKMGREIRGSTQHESLRVFVFTTPSVFERNFEILLEHGAKYSVRVVSYQKLTQDFPEYCKSFGIIAASKDKLLAEYVIKDGVKYNRFDAEPSNIERHEKVLSNIFNSAVEIESAHLPEPDAILSQMREIRDLVFERSRFAVKSVGMSQYFNIENYDLWGQKQDFYPQLVRQMLAIWQQHHNPYRQSNRILEVGAKTGHFTRHLTTIEADIWALELDWVCYKKLENRLTPYLDRINLEHKDSCAYDPPYQFDYIFSCLGDRQIEFADKEKYLKNLKRNLKQGGLLIIGDEFLPPHDESDSARQAAINNYHNYRLTSVADNPGLYALARETANCAANNRGDYKLSCDRYEHLLRKTGFVFTKQQINNSIYEQVGGIFIYQAWLKH